MLLCCQFHVGMLWDTRHCLWHSFIPYWHSLTSLSNYCFYTESESPSRYLLIQSSTLPFFQKVFTSFCRDGGREIVNALLCSCEDRLVFLRLVRTGQSSYAWKLLCSCEDRWVLSCLEIVCCHFSPLSPHTVFLQGTTSTQQLTTIHLHDSGLVGVQLMKDGFH